MTNPLKTADIAPLVRSGDYRRFLCIQLAPPEQRTALYAVTAFYLEMKRIPLLVSEPVAGFMRYAWWREALEEIAAGKPARQHPVLQGLEAVAAASPSAYRQCFAIIEACQLRLAEEITPSDAPDEAVFVNEAWHQLNATNALRAWQEIMESGQVEKVGPYRILRLIYMGLLG